MPVSSFLRFFEQTNKRTNGSARSQGGYTLIEVLLVLTILALSTAMILPFLGHFQQQQTLSSVEQDLMQALRRAQHRAIILERSSAWGVAIQTHSFTTYAGSSYGTRNTAFDKTETVSAPFSVSGLSDVSFAQVTGLPGTTGTVTVTDTTKGSSMHIDINAQGGIVLRELPANAPASSYADLAIGKTGPSTVKAGHQLSYTLNVSNNGTVGASNVVITDPLPSQLTFSHATGNANCSLQGNGSRVVCTVASIAAGHAQNVQIFMDAPSAPSCVPATLSNTATVSSDTFDSDDSNNVSQTVSTTLTCS